MIYGIGWLPTLTVFDINIEALGTLILFYVDEDMDYPAFKKKNEQRHCFGRVSKVGYVSVA